MFFGPLGKSDHCVLSFSLNVGVEAKNPIQKYIYGSDDYTPMREELHANQDSFIEDGDVNRLWEKFKQTILNLRDKYVPLKELKYWKEKGSISLTEYLNDRKTIRKSFGPMFELNYPQSATSQHCFIQKLKPWKPRIVKKLRSSNINSAVYSPTNRKETSHTFNQDATKLLIKSQ